MDLAEIDLIGRTAFQVAALRAAEDRRPDRLCADPYAALFLDAAGVAPNPRPDERDFVAIMADQVAVRTRFLDEALIAAGSRQVALIASGMDSRAWRLDWPPDTVLFELDQPGVLRFKDEVLATRSAVARCDRRAVPVDLRTDWGSELLRAGFEPRRPTAWLVEGLLYALDEAAADRLLAAITALSAPGSSLAFDHLENSDALRSALARMHPGLVGLWQPGPRNPADWLRRHGWQPELHELGVLAREHGRRSHPAYDPAAGGTAHAWLGRALLPAQPEPARS